VPAPVPNYAHPAKFLQEHDGDSFWLAVDFGRLSHGVNLVLPLYVRLADIDCWELSQPLGPAAAHFTASTLTKAPAVTVQTYKELEKFGRVLCRVWAGDDYLPDLLRAGGYEKNRTTVLVPRVQE
jgi:endonuclease YncB( thermonuclease family)